MRIYFLFVLLTVQVTQSKVHTNSALNSVLLRGKNAWKIIKSLRHDPLEINPESYYTAVEIITKRGYPAETYSVPTEDGYILELHRIPRGKAQTGQGKPVYLQHGVTGSSADWLISPAERSLAFRLADAGYDVWLGNLRGNTYSRKHQRLDPKGETFWDFSWDEMGKYDVTAMINYILYKTNRNKLIYIGHSMGCTVFFVCMIWNPAMNDKIESMIALAPATNLANMKSPFRYLSPFAGVVESTLRLFQARAFLDNEQFISQIQDRFCSKDRQRALICRNMMFSFVGDDGGSITLELLPVIGGHLPAGTSVKTIVQFAQNYNSGKTFIPYNYGWLGNLIKYGQTSPPPYDLKKVTAPVYIFYGHNDLLVVEKDVTWLAGQLSNVKGTIRVDDELYNHFDFVWATNNNALIYDQILSLLPGA